MIFDFFHHIRFPKKHYRVLNSATTWRMFKSLTLKFDDKTVNVKRSAVCEQCTRWCEMWLLYLRAVFPVEPSRVSAAVEHSSRLWTRRSRLLAQFHSVSCAESPRADCRLPQRPGTPIWLRIWLGEISLCNTGLERPKAPPPRRRKMRYGNSRRLK